MTKKEEPLNVMLAELIEVKSLTFPVSLRLWEFQKPVSDRCSINASPFIISEKVNENSKSKHKRYKKHLWICSLSIMKKRDNKR